MSCRICGRNSCTESFHSLKEQEEHEETFGKYEDKIDDLVDKLKESKHLNDLMWSILTKEQREEIEQKL